MAKGSTEVLNDDAPPSAEGCVIYVADSPSRADVGKSCQLRSGSITLGTGDDNDLVLTDSSVSGRHLALSLGPDGVSLRDLESTNGTTYHGQRVSHIVITSGARLMLGRTAVDIIPFLDADDEAEPMDRYGALVGSSAAMQKLYTQLRRLERSEAPILISGETGTGKEVIARAIHEHSQRKDKALIVVNCGAIPENLGESELFGHVKGAFTGANQDRSGAFAEAHGGTLFLDEIGEMPLELQPILLRALESGEVRRVGETRHRKVDVRVIAATNRNLLKSAEKGEFRSDLYYRLAVINLVSEPLRKRLEDIPALIESLSAALGIDASDIPRAAHDFFRSYDWPGNVRELRNVVQRVAALGSSALPAEISGAPEPSEEPADETEVPGAGKEFREARKEAIARFERAYIAHLWEELDHNVSAVAREAGLDRKYVRVLLKKYGLYD